jgi:hypothetical protein
MMGSPVATIVVVTRKVDTEEVLEFQNDQFPASLPLINLREAKDKRLED